MPARFRPFPDDTRIAFEWDEAAARIGPILKLLYRYVVARLPARTAGEKCPGQVDHVRRAFALIKERGSAVAAEPSDRLGIRVIEARDAFLTLHYTNVFAPAAYIGRVCGAMRTTAWRRVIVPGPKSRKVDF